MKYFSTPRHSRRIQVESFNYPFRHWLVKGLPIPKAPEYPSSSERLWVRYNNDCEMHKRTCEDVYALGRSWHEFFVEIAKCRVELEEITEISPLLADFYGAGLHATDPGGWLQPHLDYAIHPVSGWERRINLVLFLNELWKPEWGGAFQLLDDGGREVVKSILPEPGLAIVWEAGDNAFHATQQTSLDAAVRDTVACYYLSTPRPGATRKRALFVPRRQS